MSKKDPAFLFYSKDWLEGTGEMTAEEKGVYIDLLAHQHQKGSLPVEIKRLSKLVGLGEIDFLKIWEDIKHKFKVNSDNRLVNRKLTDVITERFEKGRKNKIISALAVAVRQSNLPYEVKFEAKKGFNINDFIDLKEPFITEKVTEWFAARLKSIANANANEDANANANVYNNSIVSKMLQTFKKFNKEYPSDKNKDATACYSIAVKIGESKGWNQQQIVNGKQEDVLSSWEKIVQFIVSDAWFSGRSLQDLNNEWQRVVQKMSSSSSVKNSHKTIDTKEIQRPVADDKMVSKYIKKH